LGIISQAWFGRNKAQKPQASAFLCAFRAFCWRRWRWIGFSAAKILLVAGNKFYDSGKTFLIGGKMFPLCGETLNATRKSFCSRHETPLFQPDQIRLVPNQTTFAPNSFALKQNQTSPASKRCRLRPIISLWSGTPCF